MIDYEEAFEALMAEQGGPGIIREIYQNTSNVNLRRAISKWWNARYRKRLKD